MRKKVTVLGLGAIGFPVASMLSRGEIEGLELYSVAAASPERAAYQLARIGVKVPVISLSEADRMGDIVVECLPPQFLSELAQTVLDSGRTLLVASVGGLLRDPRILSRVVRGPGRLVLPAGALGGLDGVRTITEHPEARVQLVTSKPVTSFEQTDYLTGNGIELARVTERTCLFEGTAEEGVSLFPKNVNVVAALALAGIGSAATHLTLWADPTLTANEHWIEAQSPVSCFSAKISNLPDRENPRTSAITAFSILATLRNLSRNWQFM